MRKIAVVGGFAVGAALTFAPLASADTPITTTVDSEISSLNSLFSDEVSLAGDSKDLVSSTTPGVFDTVPLADAPDSGTTPTTFGEPLYGLNSIAEAGSHPGAYDLFNGALGEFDNAYNVELYAADNSGALVPTTDIGTDLIGTGDASDALATGSVTGAFESFLPLA